MDRMKTLLHGKQADTIKGLIAEHPAFELVETDPAIVVCYGGDGTLLTAEQRWPGVPKVPILNSSRGNRCIARPPEEVLDRLSAGDLARTEFTKLECRVEYDSVEQENQTVVAMNEVNVHMGNINSAVRVQVWLGDEPYNGGNEILGDGMVVSTPFGSTAYYNKITRSEFYTGLGIAFNNTGEHTSHVVVPDNLTIRVRLNRGPAVLSFDNSHDYIRVEQNDMLIIRKHVQLATIYTWAPVTHPSHDS
jgi:NAD+ kinase